MDLKFDLAKIKLGTDKATWIKACDLYQNGKVKDFDDNGLTLTATVIGTHAYKVIVSKKRFSDGDCSCYMGQNDFICKHMIALALFGVKKGEPLTNEEMLQQNEIVFSKELRELTKSELSLVKAEISGATRYIKAYEGPSRTWFAYQDSLTEGCNRLAAIFSTLPISIATADLIVKSLIRIDKKLTIGGVDDSDGTVGGFIEDGVKLLIQFSQQEPKVTEAFKQLEGIESCFGWEEELICNRDREMFEKK